MAFDLLWWFDAKKKTKQKKTKQNKTKTKQKNKKTKKQKKTKKLKKKIVCLVFFNILGVIKGHLGSRDLLFLYKLGESIVRSFSMDLGNTLGIRFGLLRTRSLDHD